MDNIGKFMKKYWKCKIMRKVFWSQWEKKIFCFAACIKAHSNRWISFRPLTDHAEVLTDHIEIPKYSNRQKVIYTLYCKIETKFLFLWTIRTEPTLIRANFFVSLIQFMPMSKTYIPKMGPKKAVRPPTPPWSLSLKSTATSLSRCSRTSRQPKMQ